MNPYPIFACCFIDQEVFAATARLYRRRHANKYLRPWALQFKDTMLLLARTWIWKAVCNFPFLIPIFAHLKTHRPTRSGPLIADKSRARCWRRPRLWRARQLSNSPVSPHGIRSCLPVKKVTGKWRHRYVLMLKDPSMVEARCSPLGPRLTRCEDMVCLWKPEKYSHSTRNPPREDLRIHLYAVTVFENQWHLLLNGKCCAVTSCHPPISGDHWDF